MKAFNTEVGHARGGELPEGAGELGAQIVDLLSAQVNDAGGALASEPEVCRAFSQLLLRRWDLCCLVFYLRQSDGGLSETAFHTRPEVDAGAARALAGWLAGEATRTGRELHVELAGVAAGGEPGNEPAGGALKLFEAAGMRASLALPIEGRGSHRGTLVCATAYPERLRAALRDLRYVIAPLFVALGNAGRSGRLDEQGARIEQLVGELRERGAELEGANRELQELARYRSMILARMSHELRTPLTSVLGFAEILLEHENLNDRQRGFCEKIEGSGRQLEATVKQLLDLSRLEAGRAELFFHEFSIRETLRESCAAVGQLADRQGVKVNCVAEPMRDKFVSDESKLRQIFYNLLAHAIARSRAGGEVLARAWSVGGARLGIEISDEGETGGDALGDFAAAGVEPDGAGVSDIGLAIAHRLSNLLHGTFTLEARQPRGLRVRLEFPARPPEGRGDPSALPTQHL